MPQVFQVLRCYKCLIFQVHQTKKINKWSCNVCGEKQSVKRHYGIGTAKDCRFHVQKLNHMQGIKEESIIKHLNSENFDFKEHIGNTEEMNDNKAEINTCNVEQESKWSVFVDRDKICDIDESEYNENEEVYLEPQKRMRYKKSRPFKALKKSHKSIGSNKIVSGDELNSNKCTIDSSNLLYGYKVKNHSPSSREKHDIVNVNNILELQTNKRSKWSEFISTDENNTIDYPNAKDTVCTDNDKVENKEYTDLHDAENVEYIGLQEANVENKDCYQSKVKHHDGAKTEYIHNHEENCIEYKNDCKDMKNNMSHKLLGNNRAEALFSLCNDSDLDNILDF